MKSSKLTIPRLFVQPRIFSAEYRAWADMKTRCYNPNRREYSYYGGRGIRVCERWLNSFENFLADMGRKPTSKHMLGRIENDGNYEPNNCEWQTRSQQMLNRRSWTWN